MTKAFFKLTSLSAFLIISLAATAQDANYSFAVNYPVTSVVPREIDPEKSVAPNSNAQRNFTEKFGEVANESWTAVGTGTRAGFNKAGVNYLVDYDKNGNWLSTLRVYQHKDLPASIQKQLKASYGKYEVLTTNEVSSADRLVYLIQVQNAKTIKTLTLADDQLVVVKQLKRAEH